MKVLYSLAVLLTINIGVFGQTGGISGKVVTQDGQPAAYVNVVLKEANLGTQTDEAGNFIFRHVKIGQYSLVTSFVGLASQIKAVEVTEGAVTEVSFRLIEDASQLEVIEVRASRGLNELPATIGKVNINPMDLPQSVMVIDKSVLERQQVLTVADALMNTNGVYVMGATGGTQIEIAGRGFAYGSNSTFKNGVRYNNAVMPEMSALERVEFMKGSAAILFGQVGAGGVMNLATKKPLFQQGGQFSLRGGSYGMYKPTLDFYGSINDGKHAAYRINASYENAGSFRDHVKSDRIYFNPSFVIKAGKKTEILVEGDLLKDNRTLDFGTAAINYKIADIPRSRFLNTSWAYYKAEQKSATITVTRNLSDGWKLRVVGSYQGFNQDQYGTTRPNGSSNLVKADGTWVRGLQRTALDQKYYIGQADVTGGFNTGFIEHKLLVGTEVDQYQNTTPAYAYTNPLAGNKNIYDTINVYDLSQYKMRRDIPDIALVSTTKNPINRFGVYAQDLLTLHSKLKVLAGIRYTYVDTRSTVFNPDKTVSTTTPPSKGFPDAFSPRLGIVYQPIKPVSLFVSYSNSFDLNTGTDNKGKALPVSSLDQYEAGVKTELLRGILAMNITTYRIINSNFAQTILQSAPNYNSTYPAAKELAGEVTSKGVELDIMTKTFNGFSVIAGYAFNDTRYTKSNTYVANSRLRYNPQHTANASIVYTFENGVLKGFNLGFTSVYIGDRVAGRSTRTNVANDTYKLMTIPNYYQFDLTAGYTVRQVTFRGKVSNLFNVLSYNVHDDNSVNPIAPRLYSVSVSYKL